MKPNATGDAVEPVTAAEITAAAPIALQYLFKNAASNQAMAKSTVK